MRCDSHRQEIDGLRAFAVLAVIINHFSHQALPSGYLGVDIFFVISGYVITASLLTREIGEFKNFIVEFYKRRVKRLYPALLGCFIVGALLISFFNPAPKASLWTGVSALLGISNILLYKESIDYFSPGAALNMFTHTWSLGVEEQFYLILPVLVWIYGRNKTIQTQKLSLLVGLLSFFSFLIFIYLSKTDESAAYFLGPARFWELGAGVLIFLKREYLRKILNFSRNSFFINTVFLLLLFILFLPQNLTLYVTMCAVLLTAFLLLNCELGSSTFKILSSEFFVKIGIYSYSLYLYHWIVIVLSRWTVGMNLWLFPVQIILIFGLGFASYTYIEKPLRFSSWRLPFPKSKRSYVFTCLFFISFAVIGAKKIRNGNLNLYSGVEANLEKAGVDSLKDAFNYDGSIWRSENCAFATNTDNKKEINLNNCTIGKIDKNKRRFLVIGNSFAPAFFEMYSVIPDNKLGSIAVTASWGSLPVPNVDNKTPWKNSNEIYWKSVNETFIDELNKDDVVIGIFDLAFFSPKNKTQESRENLSLLSKGLDEFSKRLNERGIKFGLLGALPFLRESNCPPSSSLDQWFSPFGGPCVFYTKEETVLRLAGLTEVLNSLKKNNSNFFTIDLFDDFCPNEKCVYKNKNGEFLYRDHHSHPSVEAARAERSRFLSTLHKELDL